MLCKSVFSLPHVQIASELEALGTIKEPLKSDLLNGKWELIYTTSRSILQTQVTNQFLCFLYYALLKFNPTSK
jgi:PAP_fibrillin